MPIKDQKMNPSRAEIIFFHSEELHDKIEVRLEEETVWLSQIQMVRLFGATKQNISLHINNIYKEKELTSKSTVKEYLTIQKEGNRSIKRSIKYYNLDVIISIGYRVKSIRGTQFRIWANKVLKDYLLKGYAFNNRFNEIENRLTDHDKKLDFLIDTTTLPAQGIFYDGQIFDAWQFVSDLNKSAKSSIILIDNYCDDTVLSLLSKRKTDVTATIYTAKISKQLILDLKKHNAQYPKIEIKAFKQSHDRFLIIDKKTVYHIGVSLKDLGKKWFAFSKINIDAKEMIYKLQSTN